MQINACAEAFRIIADDAFTDDYKGHFNMETNCYVPLKCYHVPLMIILAIRQLSAKKMFTFW